MSKRVKVDSKRWPGVYKLDLKTGDTAFYITFKDGEGRKRWEKVGVKSEGITPQIASEIRSERLRNIRHGEEVRTTKEIKLERALKNKPIKDIATAYFEDKEDTLKGYVTDKNRYDLHLEPVVGRLPVSKITMLTIAQIKKNLAGKAPATIFNVLELLRRIINYGHRHKMNPKLDFVIDMPRRDNDLVEYLNEEQLLNYFIVLDNWKYQPAARMLKLAMFTGMRRGEIFALTDKDLDFEQGLITIRNPKGGKTSSIPMSKPVREILLEQTEWRDEKKPESAYIFPGKTGGKLTDSSAVDRIKEEAGLPKSWRPFHGLRHHFAVTLANSGKVSLDMIQELLCHKSQAMTKRYGQFLPQTKRAAADVAAELLQPKNGKSGIEITKAVEK